MSYQEIISAVRELSREERRRLAAAIVELDEGPSVNSWDERIAEDAQSGKLGFLFDEVDEAKRSGTLTPLHEHDGSES